MFLIDTNIVSELRKTHRADAHALAWASGVEAFDKYLSVISLQELEVGVLQMERRDPKQGAMLRNWLSDAVLPSFQGRILPVDAAIATRSAQLQVPNPRPYRDVLIAATALVYGMTVVTRNVTDFASTGVSLLNPFVASPKEIRP
jgi:toxin FitB